MENIRKEKIKQDFIRLHTAKRTMVFVVRSILMGMVVILLCALAFFTAERASNLYILASEGMSARTAYILGKSNDPSVLEEYFLPSCMSRDPLLGTDLYDDYTISSYRYNLKVKKVSVLPWASTATLIAEDQISMKGAVNADRIENGMTSSDYPLPEWPGGTYRILFVNDGERWFISELEIAENDASDEPLNTPDLSRSILPMATPTPTIELYDLR